MHCLFGPVFRGRPSSPREFVPIEVLVSHTRTVCRRLSLAELNLLLVAAVGSVLEQLLDQVDVRHDHAAAAVPSEAELVHRVTIGNALVDEDEISLPQVARHLAAGETPDRDDHLGYLSRWAREK